MTPWSRDKASIPVVPSTSCAGGVSPSAPCALHRFNKDVATALAVAQARMAPHLIRHACSTRLLMSAVSCLGRAFANWLGNEVVSVDMRPPTSMPRTTRRALLLGPTTTNSGYVRSFRRRALSSTTPSMFSAPLCEDPSQWRAHTTAASTANWHLPNKGIHNHLEPASVCGPWFTEVQITDHDVGCDSGCRAFQREPPSPQHPCSCARCSVVAKLVDMAATQACVQRKRQRESETSQHHNTEQVRRDPCEKVRWGCRQGHSSAWTCLGPHLCSVARPHVSEQLLSVLVLDLGGCNMLPSPPGSILQAPLLVGVLLQPMPHKSNTPVTAHRASAAAPKAPPSAPSSLCMNKLATSGCLLKIMGMQSAQLAQHAGVATLIASRKPMPPRFKLKLPLSRLRSVLGPRANILHKHFHKPSLSCCEYALGLLVSPPATSNLLWRMRSEARRTMRIANQGLQECVPATPPELQFSCSDAPPQTVNGHVVSPKL